MKYFVFYEYNFEDIERLSELYKQMQDEREKGSDKFPEPLFDAHNLETELIESSKDIQGFWVMETNDPMHLVNWRMHVAPYIHLKFIPLSGGRQFTETWLGLNR